MNFKIIYYYAGSDFPSNKIIVAKNETDAAAILQRTYGNNSRYKITSVIPQSRNGSYVALASEPADKLAAYKARHKTKEQEHIWFYTVDSENIVGPVVLASIQNKIDERILQEDSLVMKTGSDWMTVPEFKQMDTSSVNAIPSAPFTQTHNARPSAVSTTVSSARSTHTPYAKTSPRPISKPAAAPKKYPSLVFSFWIIYLIGSVIVALISGPLSSTLADQNELDIVEIMSSKLKIMVTIKFVFLMFAMLMVYLSSTEYKPQNHGFNWHYLAQAIVFLHVLVFSRFLYMAYSYY